MHPANLAAENMLKRNLSGAALLHRYSKARRHRFEDLYEMVDEKAATRQKS